MSHAIATADQRLVSDQPQPAAAIHRTATDRAEEVSVVRTGRQILADAHTVAVVGASTDPATPAHWVPTMLQEQGWRIIPVNPDTHTVFGSAAYTRLTDVPERVDLVLVFDSSYDPADVAHQAVRVGADALWLQPGVHSPQARHIACAAEMNYVEDTCVGAERAVAGIVHGGHRPTNRTYRGIALVPARRPVAVPVATSVVADPGVAMNCGVAAMRAAGRGCAR